MVTASAGRLIANAYGGQFSGQAKQTEIRTGVQRPIRNMSLRSPLTIGPLRVNSIDVRVNDGRSAASIADPDAEDSAEIIVSGQSGRKPSSYLLLGLDAMRNRATITFDKAKKNIELECHS